MAPPMTTTGVRNPAEAKKAVEKYLEHSKLGSVAKLHFEQLDIGSMKSVRAFAGKVQSKFDKIHILINNGTYARTMMRGIECGTFGVRFRWQYQLQMQSRRLCELKRNGTQEDTCCWEFVCLTDSI